MKAVVFYGLDDLRVEDRPIPSPASGEVLLRVQAAGICMTDLHIALGHFTVRPPRVLGHELAGKVESVGASVDPSWIGQSVGISPARFCGQCAPCRHGAAHLCANFECLGNTHDGGFEEYTLVHADQLVRLDGMPIERAVWMEPLACVLHAVESANPRPGSCTLVIGAGTLGRLLIQALRLTRDTRIAVVDPNPAKVDAALKMGADAGWIVPRTGSTPEVFTALQTWADGDLSVIIETSGKSTAIERALDWAVAQTRIVLFGVSAPSDTVRLSPSAILGKEATITAVAGMTTPTFAAARSLLADHRLDIDALIERIIGLEDVPGALAGMRQGSAGKIIVRP